LKLVWQKEVLVISLSSLLGGGIQTYILIFGILVVVAVLSIFKISGGASWPGLVGGFFTSIILTCLAFVAVNPDYAFAVFFDLAIGFGAMGLLYFSRTWSGFAASVVIALVVLAIYMYTTHPAYGFAIGALTIVALVVFGYLTVTAYGISKGYARQKPEKFSISLTDQHGRKMIASGSRGGFIGPGTDLQEPNSPMQIIQIVAEAQKLFANPVERAKYIGISAGYDEAAPYLDVPTAQAMLLLQSRNANTDQRR
jgi:hypothetical protein